MNKLGTLVSSQLSSAVSLMGWQRLAIHTLGNLTRPALDCKHCFSESSEVS